jgi:RecA-family ATPase
MQSINGGEPLSIADNNKMDRQGAIADSKVENRKHRFHLVPFEEIQLGTEPQYLVKGIIPRVGLTVIWGPPKCGKSFWIFDVAMHVALGWPYRGRRVQQGPVVYCAFEGQNGISARVEAFRKTFPINADQPVPFYLEPVTP